MNESKIIATDIYAAKKIGITSWLNSSWPIPDDEFYEIVTCIYNLFDELYQTLDETEQDVLLSDNNFILFLIDHAHAMAVQSVCQKNKIKLIVGKLAKYYYRPNWEKLALSHIHAISDNTLKYRLKKILKNTKFNFYQYVKKGIGGLRKADGIGLGTYSRIKREYVLKNSLIINHTYWPVLLNGCNRNEKVLNQKFNLKIFEFIENLNHIFHNKFGFEIEMNPVKQCWIQRLTTLWTVYNYFLGIKKHYLNLFVTETAHPINKIIAHAFSRKGLKSTGFHHGNGMGGIQQKLLVYNDKSSYNEFICPTSGCAKSYEMLYSDQIQNLGRQVRFLSVNSDYYKNLWLNFQNVNFPENIKSVMLMGFPMNAHRYFDVPAYFFPYQLKLELKLVRLLKASGFKVIYKIHPERLEEGYDIFNPICDAVISDPFEKSWHHVDALIIKYTASTTFGFALCTNRPIFLFDLEKKFWNHEHFKLLEKRCQMISSWTNDQNEIMFDEESLLRKLTGKPEMPDFSYLKTYMFPDD